jgi:superfamily II DNA or RNA helicase
MLRHFSSRQGKPYQDYLNQRLQGAANYWRIAGYFTTSVLELAGDAIEQLAGKARIVCNTQLDGREFNATGGSAMNHEWGQRWPDATEAEKKRFARLLQLLESGKLEIKVAPDDRFGLVHGKAGVIEQSDGSRFAFLGSNNETRQAWRGNYELMWEDDTPESVEWVMAEFDALWEHAIPLSDFVFRDIHRLANGKAITIESWRKKPDGDAAVTTNDLYRKALGLRGYQQQFVETAFRHHVEGTGGARFLLADQVGLGKTPQMALAAALMGLHSAKPVLIIVPKTLVEQWQTELIDLLGLPSARWDSLRKHWITENGEIIPTSIDACPRRIGIISQGLVVHSCEIRNTLVNLRGGYACVVIDEAHRARVQRAGKKEQANNLMVFAREISGNCQSFILGTATPVQLDPIEAFDLLEAIDGGTDSVLGTMGSWWRQRPEDGVAIASEKLTPPTDREKLVWLGNPFPEALENEALGRVRSQRQINGIVLDPALETRLLSDNRVRMELQRLPDNSPYVRRIIQRTRLDLEEQGLLPRIDVEAFDEIIPLPAPLQHAYDLAGEYCKLLGKKKKGMGFLETLLLRRMGSSFHAGLRTTERLLRKETGTDEAEEDETEEDDSLDALLAQAGNEEAEILAEIIENLKNNLNLDAKFIRLKEFLFNRRWADRGCIVFSQYYETAAYFAQMLSTDPLVGGREIPVYAGESKAGIWTNGEWRNVERKILKDRAKQGDFPIFFGTDAASEGLNLQYYLSTLINLDSPWSPTRLDQRTGRVRRIGQPKSDVLIASFRYQGSVEDTVWQRLSSRYKQIYQLMGTLPDVLRTAWVSEALDNREEAQSIIDGVPDEPPLRIKNRIRESENPWGYSMSYLNSNDVSREMKRHW